MNYRKTSNIRCPLVAHKIVNHSDVDGAIIYIWVIDNFIGY